MTCRSLHRKPLGIPGLWPEVPISRIICLKRRSDSIFCCKSKPYRLLIKEHRVSDTAAPAVSQEAKPKQAKKNHLSGGFFRFVLTRFLLIIPTVFTLVTVVFFVMRATGDPISAALGGRLTPDELQKRVHAAGYDRPLVVQYIDYLGGLLHGDLGTTLTDNQPVISILVHYGSATFELALLSLIVALIVGIGLGRVAACRRDHAADAGIRTFAILCYAPPCSSWDWS